MKLWNKHWPHSFREFGALIHLSLIFFGLRALLPHIRLDRALQWLHSPDRSFPHNPERFALIQRYFHALLWRFRTNPKGDCLIRSLVLFYFARRYGTPVHFHCGVVPVDNALDGHAWLSLEGKPIFEKEDPYSRYTITYSFPKQQTNLSESQKAEVFTRTYVAEPHEPLQRPVEIE